MRTFEFRYCLNRFANKDENQQIVEIWVFLRKFTKTIGNFI